MRRYRSIGLGLAVLFLISCTKSGVDDGTASTSDNAAPAKAKTTEVVVTGSLGLRTQVAETDSMVAMALPPPPPPAPGMQSAWSPPYHDVGRDKFTQRRREPVQDRAGSAGLDLLDRRRHRLLFLGPRFAQPERAAAAGRGPDRGDGQLLPLRLRAADERASSRSAPTSRCCRARGRRAASSCGSGSRAIRSIARRGRTPTSSS